MRSKFYRTLCIMLLFVTAACSKNDIEPVDGAEPPGDTNNVNKYPTMAACWGDSFTDGGYPKILASLLDASVLDRGIAGQTSTQIKDRMIDSTRLHNIPTVIWAGRNNKEDGATVKADIAAMVAKLKTDQYLIIGITNGDFGSHERKGGFGYNQIVTLNNELASIYGSKYFDIRTYLVSKYNPAVPQDVQDHTDDLVPGSIRRDQLHLTPKGDTIAAKAIYEKIKAYFGK